MKFIGQMAGVNFTSQTGLTYLLLKYILSYFLHIHLTNLTYIHILQFCIFHILLDTILCRSLRLLLLLKGKY